MKRSILILSLMLGLFANTMFAGNGRMRSMKYSPRPAEAAGIWQEQVRAGLFDLLGLNHLLNNRKNIPINPEEITSEDKGEFLLKEMEIQSTPDRRIRVLVTFPKHSEAPWPAVVCIHGHGGKLRSVYEKNSPYNGFASELAAQNYVTIAGFVSQHEVYENGMILMGERLWDLMRCVDYLESLAEVDMNRIGCAGLSLGGEMAMWLGAMDIRIQAEVSAGFLTKMDHMEQDHCMCWKFDGLRDLVDYADIYSLMAPRPLQCQNGLKEPVSQFYVPIAREAFHEIGVIYRDLDRPENLMLDVHNDGHVVDIQALLCFLGKHLKKNSSE
jgi:hypothetical protein